MHEAWNHGDTVKDVVATFRVGTATVSPDELVEAALSAHMAPAEAKVATLGRMVDEVARWRAKGLRVGLFTDAAAAKVKDLLIEEGNDNLKLRVFVQGGGCSGFQYGFTFDEDVNEDDTTLEKNGVSLLVDPMSFQYLVGAEIDYKEDIEGSQFVIRNPNATTTCGCGSSFSV